MQKVLVVDDDLFSSYIPTIHSILLRPTVSLPAFPPLPSLHFETWIYLDFHVSDLIPSLQKLS